MLGTGQVLFSKIPSIVPVTGPGYALVLNGDGTVTFTMIDAALGTASGTSTSALAAGVWSHVTVAVERLDPAGGRIHVDGSTTTFDPTTASGSLGNSLPLLFARDGGAGVGADFVGGLDEVEVFSRALTQPEALALYQARTSGKCKTFLELEPVIGIPITPGGTPTITTSGNLTNNTGATGSFTLFVTGEAAGTKCGALTSTVAGPVNAVVRTPQPLVVGPGQSAPVVIELDVPPGMGRGELACYSVHATHVETGRRFLSRGILRGVTARSAPFVPVQAPRD